MDRRYTQAKGASSNQAARSEALTRSKLAAARRQGRTLNSEKMGYEGGPKSIEPSSGWKVSFARGAERAEKNQIFEQEGAESLSYGGDQKRFDALPEGASRSRSRGAALPAS